MTTQQTPTNDAQIGLPMAGADAGAQDLSALLGAAGGSGMGAGMPLMGEDVIA